MPPFPLLCFLGACASQRDTPSYHSADLPPHLPEITPIQANIWLEMEGMIERTKAPNTNPIIFIAGSENLIARHRGSFSRSAKFGFMGFSEKAWEFADEFRLSAPVDRMVKFDP